MRRFIAKWKEMAFHAFLFLVPIFYLPGAADTRFVQERFFQAAVMGVASLFFGNIWLTLFMWLNLVLFATNQGYGGSQVLSVFLTGILFLVSRNWFRERDLAPYIRTLVIIALFSCLFIIMQMYGVGFQVGVDSTGKVLANETTTQQNGLFFLPAFSAIFLSIVASLFLFTGSWVAILFVIPALSARCSAAILAFAFLSILYAWWRWPDGWRKHIWKLVLGLGILGFLGYTVRDYKTDRLTYISRFESWHMIAKSIYENPLGHGPDSFRGYTPTKNYKFMTDEDYNPMTMVRVDEMTEVVSYYSADPGKKKARFAGRVPKSFGEWTEAHNEFLEAGFQYGVIVYLILGGLCLDIWRRFHSAQKTREVMALFACLCVYALVSTTQFPFHLARISGIFGLILGAFYAKTEPYGQAA